MATTSTTYREGAIQRALHADPVDQAFWLLRAGFVLAPILFGLDKFSTVMVQWDTYLAPWIDRIVPGDAARFMLVVGVIEIAAGILVAIRPDIGGYVVAAWLGAIVVNLLTLDPARYDDVALRDVGLAIGALALARLATAVRQRDRS